MTTDKSEIETLIILEYLEMGLVPPNVDLKSALASMNPDEARKAKRKFRKIHRTRQKQLHTQLNSRKTRKGWRKELRGKRMPRRNVREHRAAEGSRRICKAYGKAASDPNNKQKSARKKLVQGMVYSKTVKIVKPKHPMINLFS